MTTNKKQNLGAYLSQTRANTALKDAVVKAKGSPAKESSERKPRKKVTPPWEAPEVVVGRKDKMLVRLLETDKVMLKYISSKTGTPMTYLLLTMSIDEIRAKAKAIFKDEN